MPERKCDCSRKGSDKECLVCAEQDKLGYWCANCQRTVPQKRCPLCGLKARRIRQK